MSTTEIKKHECNHDWKCTGIFKDKNPHNRNIHEECSKCGEKAIRHSTIIYNTRIVI